MVLQKPVFPAEVPITEPTIADNALRTFPAVLVRTTDLLGGHASPKWRGQVYCAIPSDVALCKGARRGEMSACVDQAEVCGWKGCSSREEVGQVLDCEI